MISQLRKKKIRITIFLFSAIYLSSYFFPKFKSPWLEYNRLDDTGVNTMETLFISSKGHDKRQQDKRSHKQRPTVVSNPLNFSNINHLPPLDHPGYLIPEGKHPKVVWWNSYSHGREKFIDCPKGRCAISNNKNDLTDPLTRGIIMYGYYFRIEDIPLPRLPHHEWALFHEESPFVNYRLSLNETIRLFNHTATFRRESDYPLTTQFLYDPSRWFRNKYYVNITEKNRLQKEDDLAPVFYAQSNCECPSKRDDYVSELMKFIKIDSYSICLNNKKLPLEIQGRQHLNDEAYYQFTAKYKFQLAFENAVCSDYMSEKVFRPLDVGSVPVYKGAPKVKEFMPSLKAVIIATDFKGPQQLAAYLTELNEDDNKYKEYLQHRKISRIQNPELEKAFQKRPWKVPPLSSWRANYKKMFNTFSCYVCDQLHERHQKLKEHLQDPSKPLKPLKTANFNHLGCPLPADYDGFWAPHKPSPDYGQKEVETIVRMIRANETNCKNWKKYEI